MNAELPLFSLSNFRFLFLLFRRASGILQISVFCHTQPGTACPLSLNIATPCPLPLTISRPASQMLLPYHLGPLTC